MPAVSGTASKTRSIRLDPTILEKAAIRADQLGLSTSIYAGSMIRAAAMGVEPLSSLHVGRISRFARVVTSLHLDSHTWTSLLALAKKLKGSPPRVVETLVIRELSTRDREFTIWPEPKSPKPTIS